MKQLLIYLFVFLPFTAMADFHKELDDLLKVHVKGADVDYKGLVSKVSMLDVYLKKLKDLDISKLNKSEEMAMWINAYNACTLKLILDHYPLDSIKDIPTSKRWKWQGFNIGGEMLSLDEIEHVKLRPMGEARIHFVINCASISCPTLLPEAITATKMEHQLEKATIDFLNDTLRGMDKKKSSSFFSFGSSESVHVSKLFSWFGVDFVQAEGSVVNFLKKHAKGDAAELVKDLVNDDDLSFLDYDWDLNGK